MAVGLDFFLRGVNQDPGCGGINLSIGITNFVGRLTVTVVRHDANNNGRDASAVRRSVNNLLNRVRVRGCRREFCLCIGNWVVVISRN